MVHPETPEDDQSQNQQQPSSAATVKKYKLVFLGEQSVGKTSLITRFMYDTFDETYQATIGIDFLSKTVNVNDRIIRLQLWDTAGQERFYTLIPSYIRDSKVAVVVFDLSNAPSFHKLDKWIEDIRNEGGDKVLIFIVGNKSDRQEREVSTQEAMEAAARLNAHYMETSAKTGDNVEALFKAIVQQLPESGSGTGGERAGQASSSIVNLRDISLDRNAGGRSEGNSAGGARKSFGCCLK